MTNTRGIELQDAMSVALQAGQGIHTVSSSPFWKNDGVEPAKRHRSERMRAARAQTSGKIADRRILASEP
jgi:hypothetical protein